MSQFKKYLNIVTENYIYNEADYDLKDFPMVLKNTTPAMLNSDLENLKNVLETNLNNKDNVGNIELMGKISRTLMKMQSSFDETQMKLLSEIQKLITKYQDYYGKS
jgi:uncharacterized protein YfeS